MPIRFPEQAANPFGSTNINGACRGFVHAPESMVVRSRELYLYADWHHYIAAVHVIVRNQRLARTRMMGDAINIANSQGYDASGANFRTLFFTGSYGPYCGLGQIVGPHSWVKCIDAPTITHEVGHNLGLPHANSWAPSTSNPFGAGSHCEYCGSYNTMGQGGAAYDTMMRFYLRWLTYGEAVDVSTPARTGFTIRKSPASLADASIQSESRSKRANIILLSFDRARRRSRAAAVWMATLKTAFASCVPMAQSKSTSHPTRPVACGTRH
jgi:hypothetical protein